MSRSTFDHRTAQPISTVAEAGTYVTRVCFKHGPPTRTGLELEWILLDPADPERRGDLKTLRSLLGPHAPHTIAADSPAAPLPGGGLVTIEPGGQVEISSAPAQSVTALITAMTADISALQRLLDPSGLVMSDLAADTRRAPELLLRSPRYTAMAESFDSISPAGRVMMCSTASAQVCLDVGTSELAAERWRAAHYLGPVLLAAFANSPLGADTGAPVVSARMSAWWELDPARTLPPETFDPADYPARVLDTQVLARRRADGPWLVSEPLTLREWAASGEPLTAADIDLHLSMLFPPVRPQGYLEFRYLDQQPAGEWVAPPTLIAALFRSGESVRQVLEACADVADRWRQATEYGLADPALRRAAAELHEIARPGIAELDLDPATLAFITDLLDRRLRTGISPAMDALPHPQPENVPQPDRELR